MKNTKRLLLLGIVFSLLLAPGLAGIQPSYAHRMIDCEVQRFSDFMDADAQYTTTFRLWYFEDPTSCQQQCGSCDPITDPGCAECINSCNDSRYNSFTSAQDNLMAVAFRSCDYNPNVCGEAHYRGLLCNAAYNAHWGNPVYDENGNIDGNWMYFIFQEYMACRAASGIDNCE